MQAIQGNVVIVPSVAAIVAAAPTGEPSPKAPSKPKAKLPKANPIGALEQKIAVMAQEMVGTWIQSNVDTENTKRKLVIEAALQLVTKTERDVFLDSFKGSYVALYPQTDMVDKTTGKRLTAADTAKKIKSFASTAASEFSTPMRLNAEDSTVFKKIVDKCPTHHKFLAECRKAYAVIADKKPRVPNAPKQKTMSKLYFDDLLLRLAGMTTQQADSLAAHLDVVLSEQEAKRQAFNAANADKAQKDAQAQADKQIQLQVANG